jgi:hypothetical protein
MPLRSPQASSRGADRYSRGHKPQKVFLKAPFRREFLSRSDAEQNILSAVQPPRPVKELQSLSQMGLYSSLEFHLQVLQDI